ncbi:hypothetical protein HCU01_09980 [Halomonas cupida]|uniref:Uncharacterized protein n=1 Tax=Halomonas cupida TaxID=44933 RepID=A0ABQ0WBT8_9GAMM|nr:HU family DNA-binding protein [Halomonas cupida]GEN23049.1 hypothetical protein HCU01_09980 [Halomonas cupida]
MKACRVNKCVSPPHGVPQEERKERFARMLEMTDMTRFTEPVAKGLSQGDRLILPNFGTVETCQRAARTGSNLQTGAV